MMQSMKPGRCGSGLRNAFSYFIVLFLFSVFPAQAANPASDAPPVPKEQTKRNPQSQASPAGTRSTVHGIRHWSSNDYTRLVIDLDSDADFKKNILHDPNRMYFDIKNATLDKDLHEREWAMQDKFLQRVRIGQNRPDVVRIVLDFSVFSSYSIFKLEAPPRSVIDLHHPPADQAPISKSKDVHRAERDTPVPSQAERSAASFAGADDSVHPGKPDAVPEPKAEQASALEGKTVPLANLIHKDLPDTPKAAEPTSLGRHSLTRTLGLKIGRIVLDPGHGGHDLGTVGPGGMLEKDLVLSIALKLKEMLEQKLGAEVILTRDKDIFVSLEDRTVLANQGKADLFVSIHANSSRHRSISGVETYYLDFAKTEYEREVAARENAGTGSSVRDLEDLVQQIAQADKATESRELASVIQKNLHLGAREIFPAAQNRGVRRAPFVVLIGAKMPSVLTEVAFISNHKDEKILKETSKVDQIVAALFSGIESYMKKLGSYPIASRTLEN